MPTLQQFLRFPPASPSQAVFLAYRYGRIIAANKSACLLYGYSSEAFLQMNSRDLTAPSPLLESFLERLRTQPVAYGKIIGRTSDGTEFPVLVESRHIEETNGTPSYLIKVCPLQEIQAFLNPAEPDELLGTVGNWELDFASGKIHLDAILSQILGRKFPRGLTLQQVGKFISDKALYRRIGKLSRDTALYGTPWAEEFQLMIRGTSTVRVRCTCSPVFRSGTCVGLRGTLQNIAVFKFVSEIYAEQNLQLDFLMENVNQLVAISDKQYKLIYCNDKATAVFGYNWDEFSKKQMNELVYWEDQENTSTTLNMIRQKGVVHEFQNRIITKTGELKTIIWTFRWFADSEKLYAIGTDITPQQKVKRFYEGQVMQEGEDEKQELFTELHENICQTIAAAKIYINAYENSGDKESLAKAKTMISTGLEAARSLAAVHLFPDLRLQPFVEALRLFFVELNKSGRTKFILDTRSFRGRDLPYAVKTMLYRIIQVLTARMLQQADTDKATLRLLLKSSNLILDLRYKPGTDGEGCLREGNILARLQSRLDQLGGSMTVKPDTTGNCRIIIELDLMKHVGFANVFSQTVADL